MWFISGVVGWFVVKKLFSNLSVENSFKNAIKSGPLLLVEIIACLPFLYLLEEK